MNSPVVRIFDQTPETFVLCTENGTLLSAEWRADITQEDEAFHALCYFKLSSEPATYANAVALLVACRYTTSEEIALMRKSDDDPEKVAHEDFVAAVKAFVKSALGITEEEESAE